LLALLKGVTIGGNSIAKIANFFSTQCKQHHIKIQNYSIVTLLFSTL